MQLCDSLTDRLGTCVAKCMRVCQQLKYSSVAERELKNSAREILQGYVLDPFLEFQELSSGYLILSSWKRDRARCIVGHFAVFHPITSFLDPLYHVLFHNTLQKERLPATADLNAIDVS